MKRRAEMATRSKGAVPKGTLPTAPKQMRRRIQDQFDDSQKGNDDVPNLTPAPTQGDSPTTISSISIPGTQPLSGFETPIVSRQQVQADVHQEDVVEMNVSNQDRAALEGDGVSDVTGAVGGAIASQNLASSNPIDPNQSNSDMNRHQREQVHAFSQINAYKPSFIDYKRWLAAQPGILVSNQTITTNQATIGNEPQPTINNQATDGNTTNQATNEPVTIENDVRRTLANEYQAPTANVATNGASRSVFDANLDLRFPTDRFRQPPADAIRVATNENGNARKVIDIRSLYLRRLGEYKQRLLTEAIDEVELKTILENANNYVHRIIKHVEEREDSRILSQPELDANQQLWEEASELGDFIKLNIRTKLTYLAAGTQPSVQQQSKVAHARRLLAKIEPFGGEWDLWANFKSKWVEYYHNCADLSPMDLLVKLDEFIVPRSEAYNLIASYERFLPESYHDAWNHLCETYDNPRRLVNDTIGKFMLMPDIIDDRSSYLCAHNHINNLTKTLPRMDVDVSTWDPILMYVLERKMNAASKGKWKERRPARDVAQLEPFQEFLSEQIDRADDAPQAHETADSHDRSRDRQPLSSRYHSNDGRSNQNDRHARDYCANQGDRRGNGNQSSNRSSRAGQSSSSGGSHRQQTGGTAANNAPRVKSKIVRPKKCPVCPNAEHTIYFCPEFNGLNRDGRIAKINRMKLCHNCLRSNCSAERCTLSNCPNGCGEKHNRLICKKTFMPTVNAVQAEAEQQ